MKVGKEQVDLCDSHLDDLMSSIEEITNPGQKKLEDVESFK